MNGNKRGDIDDRSDTAGDESRSHGIGHPRKCADVQRDHLAHLADLGAEQRCGGSYPCVVHQHRDARIGPQHLFDHCEIGWLCQVGGQHFDLAPGPAGNFGADDIQAPSISSNQNKVIAAVCQSVSVDRADPAGGATDQGHPHGILVHLRLLQSAKASAEKAVLQRLHNNCVAHMIILPGAAWPRVDRSIRNDALLSRPGRCFYRIARIFYRLPCSAHWRLSSRTSRRGEAKAARPMATEAIRARASGADAWRPWSFGKPCPPMVRN